MSASAAPRPSRFSQSANGPGVGAGPLVDEVAREGVTVERQRRPLHVVPERLAQRGRGPDGRDAVGVHLAAGGRRRHDRDAERRGCGRGGGRERRAAPRRRPVRVAGHRPGRDVEDGRRVAHRTRHHVLGHQSAHEVSVVGGQRVAPARGLQPDEAATRGGDPDGTAAVVGVGGGHHARGHCGRGATRRSAGRVPRVPGIP